MTFGGVPVVLFVCIRNAGRSQMAEALFNAMAGTEARARSAGSQPAEAVHPEVAEVMAELEHDLSGVIPKGFTPDILDGVDLLVTMGCGDRCPRIPGARTVDWDLDDPAGKPMDEVRRTRDEIAHRIDGLLAEIRRS